MTKLLVVIGCLSLVALMVSLVWRDVNWSRKQERQKRERDEFHKRH